MEVEEADTMVQTAQPEVLGHIKELPNGNITNGNSGPQPNGVYSSFGEQTPPSILPSSLLVRTGSRLGRVADLSKDAMLHNIREGKLSFLQDASNKTVLSEKKFSKECVRCCVLDNRTMTTIEELLGFFLVANDETRRNVNSLIREAISSTIKLNDETLVIGLLEFLQNDKKIKTFTDTTELNENAVYYATIEQRSDILTIILKWIQSSKTRKFNHKNKTYSAAQVGSKTNLNSIIYAAKRNDYERVKILLRYGYRLEKKDNMTDPLKKIELFKALASPAYIVASLENLNEEGTDFFCPVKKCFEFACEANFRKSTIPEYKREYQEVENRCEDYTISLLEQCEDLREVETFLQTRNSGNKDTNYMLAILDSRMKFAAHERFQYVLLKKFGETEIEDEFNTYRNTLWLDMSWFARLLHVCKQVPCYLLLFLYPFFYPCLYPPRPADRTSIHSPPWFCKEWRVPLNRGIYTAFSYILFITVIMTSVTEPSAPTIYLVDALLGVFITSYSMRDLGTAFFLWGLEGPNPKVRRFKKRYFTFWNNYNIVMDLLFLTGLMIRSLEYIMSGVDVEHQGIAAISSAGRILWGVAFTLAIMKMIKIGIASKDFGPIIISINALMKDVMMFLITFFVIMLAFSCGVSFMFNYLQDPTMDSGSSTGGVFTYFFWVLLQPFRGNPNYDKIADLPYNTNCLSGLAGEAATINVKSIAKCRMETMYNTACMAAKMNDTLKVTKEMLGECVISRRQGSENLQTAVVPMWVVYQFLVSVVLLRILIVMMTIAYNKIYSNLDTQWKYARLYLAIQFFDPDSLLPPPFTFLTLIMYLVRAVAKSPYWNKSIRSRACKRRFRPCAAIDIEYRSLIFNFIDNVKPQPDPKGDLKKH